MTLDRERLAAVLNADHSYYGSSAPDCRIDDRWNPVAADLIGGELSPTASVLDIGCGDGATLVRLAGRCAHGVGIDTDQSHLALAAEALTKAGVDNVELLRLDLGDLADQPWRDRFDMVYSERGPVGYGLSTVQAALDVLRPGGLLFAEVIGDLHLREVREVFGAGPPMNQVIRTIDQVKVAMERAGVGVRLATDLVSKRRYPDVYAWLTFQCGIWAWAGHPLPEPEDPRLELFARRAATADTGEIEVTHHVVRVAGVKLTDPPPYGEDPPSRTADGREVNDRSS